MERTTHSPEARRLRIGAALLFLGAGPMIAKGLVRATTGADLSLVPWFGLGTTLGLTVAALAVVETRGPSWVPVLAVVVGVVGVGASVVAVGFLIIDIIPETPGAPAAVRVSYGLLAAAAFLGLGLVGATAARRRLLRRGWRWVPLAVLGAQFPVFALSEAIGDVLGRGSLTDGLALTLTGAAWALAGYSLTQRRDPSQPVER